MRLLNANGGQLAFNDDFEVSLNSRITFSAQTSGTFYLEFRFRHRNLYAQLEWNRDDPSDIPSDDYSDRVGDASSSLGALAVGGSRTGRIETRGDTDIFAVILAAGKTYTLNLSVAASGGLNDPVMRLLNSSGAQLAINDDFGGSRNSQITFTAISSGTYYVEARAYGANRPATTSRLRGTARPATGRQLP